MKTRCAWANNKSPIYQKYHDAEWGKPVRDDNKLFEFIILESAQAGLAWETILNKRPGYRKAFKDFNPTKVAKFQEVDVKKLLNNKEIVRNHQKINSAINNAKIFLTIQNEFGSFSNYLWGFVNQQPIKNSWQSNKVVPTTSPLAVLITKDLKNKGFQFFGPTICYSFLQAVGIVNDHTTDCFYYEEINKS